MINQKSKEGSIFCRFLWNHNLIVPATRLDLIQVLRPLFLIEKKCYFSMIWWRRWQCQCQRQAMMDTLRGPTGIWALISLSNGPEPDVHGRGQHMHLVREKSDWIERTNFGDPIYSTWHLSWHSYKRAYSNALTTTDDYLTIQLIPHF